jgi:hypothetical protein
MHVVCVLTLANVDTAIPTEEWALLTVIYSCLLLLLLQSSVLLNKQYFIGVQIAGWLMTSCRRQTYVICVMAVL